ncbi:MAG TPA: ROK family protein [Thermoplasmata archaeon]|nr:ROK family protein [Thermoplasmata archaeon]
MTAAASAYAIDIGATKFVTAIVDDAGTLLASHRHPTHGTRGFADTMERVATCVEDHLHAAGTAPEGIGVGVAAQVDRAGRVIFSPNMGWRDAPLGEVLGNATGHPVQVLNDVRAATIGEWKFGAGRGERDLVVLFIGTGVGGGVVTGGRLLEGDANSGGELGHLVVRAGGRRCHCPGSGCLEAYVGGWGIAERAQESVRADPRAGAALVQLAGAPEHVSAATVSHAWRVGDPLAHRILDETVDALVAGLVGIANALNPRRIVLGGGVVEALPHLVTTVTPRVRLACLGSAAARLEIHRAARGSDAALLGASWAAFAARGVLLAPAPPPEEPRPTSDADLQ